MTDKKPKSLRDAKRIEAGLSVAALARAAKVSEDTVRSVMTGKQGHQETKVFAIDRALDAALAEKGIETAPAPQAEPAPLAADDGLIEFQVAGNFGVSVVVRGPVADREAVEDSVLRLIRGMNAEKGSAEASSETDASVGRGA